MELKLQTRPPACSRSSRSSGRIERWYAPFDPLSSGASSLRASTSAVDAPHAPRALVRSLFQIHRRIVAVKIRLKRMGKIRAPYYRIIVADSRTKRDGRVIEEIGKYHPTEEPSFIEVDSERAQYWLSVGAQPTEQVACHPQDHGRLGHVQGRQGRQEHASVFAEEKVDFESTRTRSRLSSRRSRRRPTSLAAAPAEDAPPKGPQSNPIVLAAALEHIVKGIVDHPKDIPASTHRPSSRGDVLEVHVAEEDRGRVDRARRPHREGDPHL